MPFVVQVNQRQPSLSNAQNKPFWQTSIAMLDTSQCFPNCNTDLEEHDLGIGGERGLTYGPTTGPVLE